MNGTNTAQLFSAEEKNNELETIAFILTLILVKLVFLLIFKKDIIRTFRDKSPKLFRKKKPENETQTSIEL